MYAASGLLTYGASEDMDHIIAMLKAAGLCSEVLYKELYIPKAELDGARASLFRPQPLRITTNRIKGTRIGGQNCYPCQAMQTACHGALCHDGMG